MRLVDRHGRQRQKMAARRSVELLHMAHANLLGYVMNAADSKKDGGYGYGYGYGYRKYAQKQEEGEVL